METYKASVQIVLSFLKEGNYNASVISSHRQCYRELEIFLCDTHQDYSIEIALEWAASNKNQWSQRGYTCRKHCINQLDDVIQNGHISPKNLHIRKSTYFQLVPQFRTVLDSFISERSRGNSLYKVAVFCFLLFLQNNELTDLSELGYDLVIKFHKENHHGSANVEKAHEGIVRVFLRYLAEKGVCSFGLSLALNRQLIDQIVHISPEELVHEENCYPSINWEMITAFLLGMKSVGYSKTVLKASKHLLSLLYIFLEMHHSTPNDHILWLWFDKVKLFFGSSWHQQQRTLCQFIKYLETSTIYTKTTIDPRRKTAIDRLPDWSKSTLQDYLLLLRREGRQPSTVDMQRSSNCRFCSYLAEVGLTSFSELTAEILKNFNLQDEHLTPEGKAAYNCRIRSFVQYLYEKKLIDNPFLYKALPSCHASKTSIVETLTKEEIASIWSADPKNMSPIELRDYAIVCIGLTMGFRASDIVSLHLSDIDWKGRSIHIVQRKTGKALTMPMPVKTGNALFLYLRNGRPQSSCDHIFIRHDTPYGSLTRDSCAKALRRFTHSPGHGFHKVRKTFATNLLRGNTAVMLISDSLGHSTDDTVHRYLSLDETRMRQCPLSLLETGLSINGGAFDA